MERALVGGIFQAVLFIAVLIENLMGLMAVEKFEFSHDRKLSRKMRRFYLTGITTVSFIEFINKTVVFFFSIPMMIIKIVLVWGIIYKIRKKQKGAVLSILIVYFTLVQSVEFIVNFIIIEKVFGYPEFFSMYLGKDSIWRNTTAIVIRVILLILWWTLRNREVFSYNKRIATCLAIILYSSMIGFYWLFLEGNVSIKIDTALCFSAIVISAVLIMMVSLFYDMKKKQAEISEEQNRLLEKNYVDFYRLYRENRYLAHDLKNHVTLIEHFIESREYEKAYEYLEKIKKPVDRIGDYSYSENKIIDIILNDKIIFAVDRGIHVLHEIGWIGELDIDDKSLCIILTNLMDNSIEACEYLSDKERWIDISIKRQDHMLIIKIENPCSKENDKLITQKPDKSRHGLGLESVQHEMEYVNGDLGFKIEEGIFSVSVVLFL